MEGKGAWALMAALWLVECTAAFETAMLYASNGALMKAFGDPVKVGWIMSVYLLVGAAAGAVIGRLGDIYGRRRLILMLMGATVFAFVLSASTSLFGVILVGRALQGLAAATLPLNFGLLRENLLGERMPFGVGVVMSGSSSGIALGLVAGGAVVDRFGWHSVFIVSAVLAAASLALVRAVVPPSPQNREASARLDWSSIALFGPGIVALLVAISNGSAWGWTSAATLAVAAAGIGSLTLWTVRSLRHAAPLIDLRLFANRSVALADISFALLSLGRLQVSMIFSLLLLTPTWTGVGLGVSAAMARVLQMPGSLVGMIAGPAAGIAMQRLGGGAVMLFGGLIAALGWTVACAWHRSTSCCWCCSSTPEPSSSTPTARWW
jgi:MFS family permease